MNNKLDNSNINKNKKETASKVRKDLASKGAGQKGNKNNKDYDKDFTIAGWILVVILGIISTFFIIDGIKIIKERKLESDGNVIVEKIFADDTVEVEDLTEVYFAMIEEMFLTHPEYNRGEILYLDIMDIPHLSANQEYLEKDKLIDKMKFKHKIEVENKRYDNLFRDDLVDLEGNNAEIINGFSISVRPEYDDTDERKASYTGTISKNKSSTETIFGTFEIKKVGDSWEYEIIPQNYAGALDAIANDEEVEMLERDAIETDEIQ